MGLARSFCFLSSLWFLATAAQAVPQPAQIQVVQNLVIPGRVVDLMPDAMLLKAPSGEAFVLPRNLGIRLDDTKIHPHLEVGSQISAMVPLDSSEVVTANGRLVVLKTGTGLIQLPVSLMPKDMLSNTLIGTKDKKGQAKESTLAQAIQAGGLISPDSFAYWNQPQTGSGVVIAKRPEGDLLLATMESGLPAIRQLKTGGMSTDWITVGSPITVVRDPQLPFYQVQPWKDAAYWEAAQHPVVEPASAPKIVHRGTVPRKAQVSGRRLVRQAGPKPRPLAHLPARSYPRAAVYKARAVAIAPQDETTSLLVPIYNVVSSPLRTLTVAARPKETLTTYTDHQLGLLPGYNFKTRAKDSLPGY